MHGCMLTFGMMMRPAVSLAVNTFSNRAVAPMAARPSWVDMPAPDGLPVASKPFLLDTL